MCHCKCHDGARVRVSDLAYDSQTQRLRIIGVLVVDEEQIEHALQSTQSKLWKKYEHVHSPYKNVVLYVSDRDEMDEVHSESEH